MDGDRLLALSRQLSTSLTPGDLDHTLSRVTAAAVEALPDVEFASISMLHSDGHLETVAPTDETVLVVDKAQDHLREGPCYAAAADDTFIVAPDLANDERFPQYAEHAVAAGIRAQAGISLFEAPKCRGALNLYASTPGSFGDLDGISELFRHQAAVAIDYARDIENLQEAVKTRSVIGTAVGIVMERYNLSDERAFAFLTRLSQDGNVKLRLIAERLVEGSEQES